MTASSRLSSRPASLKATISLVEKRMTRRRGEIGDAMTCMADTLRDRMVSARGLATAVLLGVMLERHQRHRHLSLLKILRAAANASIWPLLTLVISSGAAPGHRRVP